MKIYIIWHKAQDRPAIAVMNYGSLAGFPTLAQAQAYVDNAKRGDGNYGKNYEIREFNLIEIK